jgi:hypothetical protein
MEQLLVNEKVEGKVEQKKDAKVLVIRTGVRAGVASSVRLHID